MSAIEISLGLGSPGWSITVGQNRQIIFKNSAKSYAPDIEGRILLYKAIAEFRAKIKNPDLLHLVLNNILFASTGANSISWSPYRSAFELRTLTQVIASSSSDSSEICRSLNNFGVRPQVFLIDAICMAAKAVSNEDITLRSVALGKMMQLVLPLIPEPKTHQEAREIVFQTAHDYPRCDCPTRLANLSQIMSEVVLSPESLNKVRRILYRCWEGVTKIDQPSSMGVLQRVREIAKSLPGEFLGWQLPQRYLELDSDPKRLFEYSRFVSELSNEGNYLQIQALGTKSVESFVTNPLGFSRRANILGIQAVLAFSAEASNWLKDAPWENPEARFQIGTIGAVLIEFGWNLRPENATDSQRFKFVAHVANVLHSRRLDCIGKVAEVLAEYPQMLPFADLIWKAPSDFVSVEPNELCERYKYRVVFESLRAAIFVELPDLKHELEIVRGLYKDLGRDLQGLFVGIRSLADVSEAKLGAQQGRAMKIFNLHLLSGIVEGRVQAKDPRIVNYLRNELLLDAPPYPQPKVSSPDSPYQKCIQEVAAVQFAALDRYFGQGAWKYAFQRPVPGGSMQFEDFLKACSRSYTLVEGYGDRFPGSGAMFSRIGLRSVFDEVTASEVGSYYPWAQDICGDVQGSIFAFMRGLRLVVPPDGQRYQIGRREYCLLSFQDHFGDEDINGVCLISKSAGKRLVAFIKQGDTFSSSTALLRAIKYEVNDVMPLTELANFGGFSHAFEPNSAPYLIHMPEAKQVPVADYLDHVHASMISGSYSENPTPLVEAIWEQLRAAHAEVRDVATRLLNLEGMLRVIYSRFNMGHDFTTADGDNIYPSAEFHIPGEVVVPKFAERSLIFGLRYAHALRSAGVTDINRYPVLVLANPLDNWSKLGDEPHVDLYDSCARFGFSEHKFGSYSALSDWDIHLWRKEFWEPANERGFEIRFEDRRRIFG